MRLSYPVPQQVLDDGFSVLLARLIGLELAVMPAWIYKKAAMEAIRKNEPPNYNGYFMTSFLFNLTEFTRLFSERCSQAVLVCLCFCYNNVTF